jgi:hypothetical protein
VSRGFVCQRAAAAASGVVGCDRDVGRACLGGEGCNDNVAEPEAVEVHEGERDAVDDHGHRRLIPRCIRRFLGTQTMC